MGNWVRLTSVAECPPGECRELIAAERVVALYNVAGQFFALDGICPHQGGPLGKGRLSGCVVTCPWHGWQYDVTTGQHQSSKSIVHTSFPVKVEADTIWVDLPS